MKIRTTVDRPGTPQGTVLDLPEADALTYIKAGTAVPVHVYSRTEVAEVQPDAPAAPGADA